MQVKLQKKCLASKDHMYMQTNLRVKIILQINK